jgi:hypothetical protein
MRQQPQSTSQALSASTSPFSELARDPAAGSAPEPPEEPRDEHHVPRWLERAELFLRVMLRMYIGLAVCYAPWSHTFWDQNAIFQQFPSLGQFATHGAVRGIVTGIGLINLWIALRDAIRRRDR